MNMNRGREIREWRWVQAVPVQWLAAGSDGDGATRIGGRSGTGRAVRSDVHLPHQQSPRAPELPPRRAAFAQGAGVLAPRVRPEVVVADARVPARDGSGVDARQAALGAARAGHPHLDGQVLRLVGDGEVLVVHGVAQRGDVRARSPPVLARREGARRRGGA